MVMNKPTIQEIEDYFNSIKLPKGPIQLNKCTTIEDPELYVKASISIIKRNTGNRTYYPYYKRLVLFKEIIALQTIDPLQP